MATKESIAKANNCITLLQTLLESFELNRCEVQLLRARLGELMDAMEDEGHD